MRLQKEDIEHGLYSAKLPIDMDAQIAELIDGFNGLSEHVLQINKARLRVIYNRLKPMYEGYTTINPAEVHTGAARSRLPTVEEHINHASVAPTVQQMETPATRPQEADNPANDWAFELLRAVTGDLSTIKQYLQQETSQAIGWRRFQLEHPLLVDLDDTPDLPEDNVAAFRRAMSRFILAKEFINFQNQAPLNGNGLEDLVRRVQSRGTVRIDAVVLGNYLDVNPQYRDRGCAKRGIREGLKLILLEILTFDRTNRPEEVLDTPTALIGVLAFHLRYLRDIKYEQIFFLSEAVKSIQNESVRELSNEKAQWFQSCLQKYALMQQGVFTVLQEFRPSLTQPVEAGDARIFEEFTIGGDYVPP